MQKVISAKNTHGHIVQAYKFRSLGGESAGCEEGGFEAELFYPHDAPAAQSAPAPAAAASTLGVAPTATIDPSFVEELMKKIDDLSTSLVKMEMQMERQQNEFATRLEEERGRAFKDGFTEAETKVREEMMTLIGKERDNIAFAVGRLDEAAATLKGRLAEFENQMTQAALLMAKEVIALEVRERSAKIASAIAKGLVTQIAAEGNITLHVNPADMEEFSKELDDGATGIHVIADQGVAHGGVVLHSETKNFDGSIATRIENLKNSILDHMGDT